MKSEKREKLFKAIVVMGASLTAGGCDDDTRCHDCSPAADANQLPRSWSSKTPAENAQASAGLNVLRDHAFLRFASRLLCGSRDAFFAQ